MAVEVAVEHAPSESLPCSALFTQGQVLSTEFQPAARRKAMTKSLRLFSELVAISLFEIMVYQIFQRPLRNNSAEHGSDCRLVFGLPGWHCGVDVARNSPGL